MTGLVRDLGARSTALVEGLGRVTAFGGALAGTLPRRPTRVGFFVRAVYDAGVLSVALICLSGFTVGMVLGLQLYTTLTRFGAEEGLGAVVGLSLVRELGRVVRTVAAIAIGVGVSFFVLTLLLGRDPSDGFIFAVGVMCVASVGFGLALAAVVVGYYIWAYAVQWVGAQFFQGRGTTPQFLRTLAYPWAEETANPVYKLFLR